jgi:hypothetical protein
MKKVLIIDTSVLCVWLEVPGMDSCGPDDDKWDRPRIVEKIGGEEQANTTFVLPLASIIETGNHISQAQSKRWECGNALADLMRKSAKEETPWAAFSVQSELWSSRELIKLADSWPDLAANKLSLGDATILDVAKYYSQMNFKVDILTGDKGLKAYEPTTPPEIPRRRARN